jgi:hypothetical protein
MKEVVKPSPALEGKFEVIGVVPGLINVPNYGNVDLRWVSLELAEKLYAEGCPYLKKVSERKSKALPNESE